MSFQEAADLLDLSEMITKSNDDSLAEQFGHVYQVWADGEVTLQKSGDLLWQRTLHSMNWGDVSKSIPNDCFPHFSGKFGYAFVTKENALKIRDAILKR